MYKFLFEEGFCLWRNLWLYLPRQANVEVVVAGDWEGGREGDGNVEENVCRLWSWQQLMPL